MAIFLDKRPGLASAVDAVRQHGAGVFLAAKRDRIARDTVIAAVVGRLVERNGGRVMTADGVASADTPEGKLMATMIDAFADYERMLIKMRTKAALAVKRQRGQRVGSIPYGYQLDRDGTTPIEHPDEQAVIHELAELRSRMSLRATVAYCREHGITARTVSGGRARCSGCFLGIVAAKIPALGRGAWFPSTPTRGVSPASAPAVRGSAMCQRTELDG